MRTPKEKLYEDAIRRVDEEESRNILTTACRYIDRTEALHGTSLINYDLVLGECRALRVMAERDSVEALLIAFLYGRAKGLRAASKLNRRRNHELG